MVGSSGGRTRRVHAPLATALCAGLLGAQLAAPRELVVGFVPGPDAEVTRSLRRGLERAFAEARPARFVLEEAPGSGHWQTASVPAVELLFAAGAVVVVTPPDRFTAHLVAQLGTRAQVPVVTTTAAPSIQGTGSVWVFPAVRQSREAPSSVELLPPFSLGPDAAAWRETADPWFRVGLAIGRTLNAVAVPGAERAALAAALRDRARAVSRESPRR